jgi:hypothetical protein
MTEEDWNTPVFFFFGKYLFVENRRKTVIVQKN